MEVFKSRRFVSTVIGGVVMLLIAALPSLENSESLLVEAFTVLVLALVGGYTLEDALQPKPGRGSNSIPSSIKTVTLEKTPETAYTWKESSFTASEDDPRIAPKG